jgi:hypothetical protein
LGQHRALCFQKADVHAKLGRNASRECEGMFCRHCERSDAIHEAARKQEWIASRSLSSGAHSRDPLARNDDVGTAVALEIWIDGIPPGVIVRLDRTIQYSGAPVMESRSCGVLDTPLSRSMTAHRAMR